MNFKKTMLCGAVLLGASGAALATGTPAVDVSAATGAFTGVADAVNDIGPLMLGAIAAGIIYKWAAAFLI